METENIERIINKSEEDSHQDQEEDEKVINEEEEEDSEKTNEKEINQINKQEKDNNDSIKQDEQKHNPLLTDPYATTTYILKYKRSKEELKEYAIETNLPKSENCLFMLNIKILKSNLVESTDENSESPNFLVICCHEIAAIYFDEIYERIYTLEDLYNENIFFKVFDKVEEARNILDESIKNNEKNPKKIFINLKDKELKLHMKLSFFDKEKEIIINIHKKILTDKDKNNLLPEFLKEIQDKMNHLKEENKKLKQKKIILDSSHGTSDFLIEADIKKETEVKGKLIDENNQIKEKNNNNDESKNLKKKVIKKKIKKKISKDTPKKVTSTEENYF